MECCIETYTCVKSLDWTCQGLSHKKTDKLIFLALGQVQTLPYAKLVSFLQLYSYLTI
jgi:hypothetical protein